MSNQPESLSSSRSNKRPDTPTGLPSDVCDSIESWRVFCAIELPSTVGARLTEQINRLKDRVPDTRASWNRDGKFHLTLKFIGEIPQARVERVSSAADHAARNFSPFTLIVEGAGVFPKSGTPKVLWLGISDPFGQLNELQALLEQHCAQAGFAKEERSFHPHLTLARLRKPHGARMLAAVHKEMGFAAVEVQVAELLVIRSELSSQGSKYTIITRHPLQAPPGSARFQRAVTRKTLNSGS